MTLRLKLGLLGFILGLIVALILAELAANRSVSSMLIISLWPTSLFGIGATGWSDGILWHLIQIAIVFGGNGVLYALVLSGAGMAIHTRMRK